MRAGAAAQMWTTSHAYCCTCAIAPLSRWWAVQDYSYVDAANDVLVVQVRAVRAIYGSLPVPSADGL